MNSIPKPSSTMSLAPFAAIGLLSIMYYLYGAQSILNPTAHQAIQNKGFLVFFAYAAVAAAIGIVSYKTQSPGYFFAMLASVSLVWFILRGSWQYTPV